MRSLLLALQEGGRADNETGPVDKDDAPHVRRPVGRPPIPMPVHPAEGVNGRRRDTRTVRPVLDPGNHDNPVRGLGGRHRDSVRARARERSLPQGPALVVKPDDEEIEVVLDRTVISPCDQEPPGGKPGERPCTSEPGAGGERALPALGAVRLQSKEEERAARISRLTREDQEPPIGEHRDTVRIVRPLCHRVGAFPEELEPGVHPEEVERGTAGHRAGDAHDHRPATGDQSPDERFLAGGPGAITDRLHRKATGVGPGQEDVRAAPGIGRGVPSDEEAAIGEGSEPGEPLVTGAADRRLPRDREGPRGRWDEENETGEKERDERDPWRRSVPVSRRHGPFLLDQDGFGHRLALSHRRALVRPGKMRSLTVAGRRPGGRRQRAQPAARRARRGRTSWSRRRAWEASRGARSAWRSGFLPGIRPRWASRSR